MSTGVPNRSVSILVLPSASWYRYRNGHRLFIARLDQGVDAGTVAGNLPKRSRGIEKLADETAEEPDQAPYQQEDASEGRRAHQVSGERRQGDASPRLSPPKDRGQEAQARARPRASLTEVPASGTFTDSPPLMSECYVAAARVDVLALMPASSHAPAPDWRCLHLDLCRYADVDDLVSNLNEKVLLPAEAKRREIGAG